MKRESPFTSTVSNVITSYANLVLGLLIGIIVNRSLGPELKGEFANLKLIAMFYGTFLLFGYHGGVLFYGVKKEINHIRYFWTGALVVLVLATIAVIVLFPLTKGGYLGGVAAQTSANEIQLALGVVPFIFFNAYTERVIRSYNLFRAANKRIIIASFTTLIYYIVLFTTSEIGLKDALFGLILGQLTQSALNLYYVITIIKVKWTLSLGKALKPFRYGLKNWLNQILNTSNDRIDQIILTFLLNASSFGLYTVGVGLSNLVTLLPTSYVNVFYNQVAEKNIEEGLELYGQAQRLTIIFTTIVALLLAACAYPVIYIMYGEEFLYSAWVVLFYTPGLIFQVAARMSIKFYGAQGKPLKNSLIYVAGIVVSLPFYFVLIPRFGIIGAAIASSIAYLSAFIFSFYQLSRDYNIKLHTVLIPQSQDYVFMKKQLDRFRTSVIRKIKR